MSQSTVFTPVCGQCIYFISTQTVQALTGTVTVKSHCKLMLAADIFKAVEDNSIACHFYVEEVPF